MRLRLVLMSVAACFVACATAATPGTPTQAITEAVPVRNDERVVILDAGPDGQTIIIESIRCYIFKRVYFVAGASAMTSEGDEIVGSWARVLNDDEGLQVIEISGYADPKEKGALALAEARAQAARTSLLAKGVAPARVRARGYGAYCAEPDGVDRNRSAVIKVIVSRDAPTGVELGCESARRAGIVSAD